MRDFESDPRLGPGDARRIGRLLFPIDNRNANGPEFALGGQGFGALLPQDESKNEA